MRVSSKTLVLAAVVSIPAIAACYLWAAPAKDVGVQIARRLISGPGRAKDAVARVRPELERDLSSKGLHFGDPVFLRAFKEEEELEMWIRHRATGKYELFRTWRIAAMSGNLGPKLAEGDGQVPEGFYFVPPRAMNPNSTYHLSFNIGFPNEYDHLHGRDGTFIMIHGSTVSIGCLAMTDEKIEEIYTLCDAAHSHGQEFFRVHIFPFRMSAVRMEKAKDHRWIGFWNELRPGYDWFEKHRVPPEVTVTEKAYQFSEPAR